MTHFKKVPDSSDGWNYAKNYINLNGNNIITEDHKHTKEVQNLVMEILFIRRTIIGLFL